MPAKRRPVLHSKGPAKKFFTTFTMRVTEEDKAGWEHEAEESLGRLSLSQWVRGVLNAAREAGKKRRGE